MCKFFSVISDGNGTPYYFNWKQRQEILKGKPEYKNITTIDKKGIRKDQSPYYRNKGNTDKLAREIKRIGTTNAHKVISRDHFDLLKDTEKYMESFNKQYEKLMEEYVEDFDEKWNTAVKEIRKLFHNII
jgi:hypothetical protein